MSQNDVPMSPVSSPPTQPATSSSSNQGGPSKMCDKCLTKVAKYRCRHCATLTTPTIPAVYCSRECQESHWPDHYKATSAACKLYALNIPKVPAPTAASTVHDNRRELQFYMQQLNFILRPVICCILLSILWVKLSMTSDFKPQQSSYAVYTESATDSNSQILAGSLLNALIILGQIVLATVIFVVLFKFGCWKALYAYLFLTVVLLLGFMGWLLLMNILQVLRIPMDYLTMAFSLWNFSIVGMIVIFWRGPLWVQQCYLVVMSSLMAFALTGLESWTTWILLAALALWDLVAVLCPYGPLKILVQESHSQNRDVPALLYSVTMIYFTTPFPPSFISFSALPNATQPATLEPVEETLTVPDPLRSASPAFDTTPLIKIDLKIDESESRDRLVDRNAPKASANNSRLSRPGRSHKNPLQVETTDAAPRDVENAAEEEEEGEEEEESGLKLGLGDFVFYSVLIARASTFDWVTTVSCVVAVLTGLTMTILLLAIFKKALPALPISIAFGLIFYFSASIVLQPVVQSLSMQGVYL